MNGRFERPVELDAFCLHVLPEELENEWEIGFGEGWMMLRNCLFDGPCIYGQMDGRVDEFTNETVTVQNALHPSMFSKTGIASDKCENYR